jgi:hypothetical protein
LGEGFENPGSHRVLLDSTLPSAAVGRRGWRGVGSRQTSNDRVFLKLAIRVIELFKYCKEVPSHKFDTSYHKTTEKNRGRIDIRECWVISDTTGFPSFRTGADWTGLKALVKVKRERRVQGKVSIEIAYYISSLTTSSPHYLQAITIKIT